MAKKRVSILLIRRKLSAARPLVVNPYATLEKQIGSTAKKLEKYFDKVDSSLEYSGKDAPTVLEPEIIKDALQGDNIETVMRQSIAQARLAGYQSATAVTKEPKSPTYGRRIRDAAIKRAAFVAKSVLNTTKGTLSNTPESDYVLGADRAKAIARYEAGRAFYRGLKDGFKNTESAWGKEWVTAAGESCDDCLDNEAEGVIDVEDDFSSGDDYPPAHIGCACSVLMSKIDQDD